MTSKSNIVSQDRTFWFNISTDEGCLFPNIPVQKTADNPTRNLKINCVYLVEMRKIK